MEKNWEEGRDGGLQRIMLNKPNPTLKTKEKGKNPIPEEEKNTTESIGNPKCPEENKKDEFF